MRAPATQPEPQRTRHATLVVMLLGALLIPTGLASGANRSPVPTVGTVELRPARAAERLGFGQVHQRNRAAQAASTADQYMTEPQAELAVLNAGYSPNGPCTPLPGERRYSRFPVRYHEWMCTDADPPPTQDDTPGTVYAVAEGRNRVHTFFRPTPPPSGGCIYSSGSYSCG